MEHDSSPLTHPEGEDLLQAALDTAFSVEDLPRQSATAPEPEPTVAPEPQPESESEPAPQEQPAPLTVEPTPTAPAADTESAPASAVSAEDYEAWKAEYDAQVAAWHKESAAARAHAAAERAKWESIREQEQRESKAVSESWESVSGREAQEHEREQEELGAALARAQGKLASADVGADAPSAADARDLVAGEHSGAHTQEFVEAALPRPTTEPEPEPAHEASEPAHAPETSEHASSSPHWEDVPSSLTSSFPSMSFPENSRPESPDQARAHHHEHAHHEHHHDHHHEHEHEHHGHGHEHPHHHRPEPASPSATLAIFDSTLSPRTRAWALVSALAINMLLPFVNGVMLGFGEIFAKNVVVGWFGFGTRGSGVQTAKNVGLGVRRK
ncbi:hypothetical protein DENSPDRAFT_926624 [Dentipellis sp. KUC8613]|nr:hypothetical protein DENSPDRAFT_926624 [Dentipellis sp. KUC8613]